MKPVAAHGQVPWSRPLSFSSPPSVVNAASLAPIRDSKLLSPRQRDRCYDLVLDNAAFWGVGSVRLAGDRQDWDSERHAQSPWRWQ